LIPILTITMPDENIVWYWRTSPANPYLEPAKGSTVVRRLHLLDSSWGGVSVRWRWEAEPRPPGSQVRSQPDVEARSSLNNCSQSAPQQPVIKIRIANVAPPHYECSWNLEWWLFKYVFARLRKCCFIHIVLYRIDDRSKCIFYQVPY